jgi:hypothetical protein
MNKMVTIKTIADLQGATIDASLKAWLESEIKGLWEHLGQGESLSAFDLTRHGPMWVATSADKTKTWRQLTIDMSVQCPEFIERHRLSDGNNVFRIGFLVDNDFMPLLYARTDCLDQDIVRWLEEQTGDYEEIGHEAQSSNENKSNPF